MSTEGDKLMQLSKAQRHNLELYAIYHLKPPAFWQLFRSNLARYLVIAALLMLIFLLAPITGTEWLALILTGVFLGALVRDISRFLQFVRMWPAISAVIDWERLDELLSK